MNENWSNSTPMPEPRSAVSAAVVGEKIYVLGGIGFGSSYGLSSSLVFDTTGTTWADGPALDRERFGAAAVTLNDQIYVIGGRGGEDAYNWDGTFSSMIIINPNSGTHVAGASMLKRRCLHSAAVVSGKIYVAGGYTQASAEVYDPDTTSWTLLPPLTKVNYLSVAMAAPASLVNDTNTCPYTYR